VEKVSEDSPAVAAGVSVRRGVIETGVVSTVASGTLGGYSWPSRELQLISRPLAMISMVIHNFARFLNLWWVFDGLTFSFKRLYLSSNLFIVVVVGNVQLLKNLYSLPYVGDVL